MHNGPIKKDIVGAQITVFDIKRTVEPEFCYKLYGTIAIGEKAIATDGRGGRMSKKW